jgi:hypothetical protein
MKKYLEYFPGNPVDRINIILVVVILFELVLKLLLLLRHKIGWDEFRFLSTVHSFQRGELIQPFQSFHVHFLGWTPWVSGNEVAQIIAARCFLFLLFLASGFLLYRIARNFVNRTGALFTIFCWLSLSNVILHGASLRYDSFCSFLFLLACFALLRENRVRSWSAIAGLAMGISLLISLKAAIHVVSLFALLGALWIISEEKKPIFRKWAVFLPLMALTFGLGFSIHQGALPSGGTPAQQTFVRQASSKAIIFKEFFPRWEYFAGTLQQNPFVWLLLGAGCFYASRELFGKQDKKSLIALSFLAPLFSLPFYRNAFPYYYVFVIAPALMLCGIMAHRLVQDFEKSGSRSLLLLFAIICLPIAGGAGIHFYKAFGRDNRSQAELLGAIHRMFPEPVPYIDGCSAVASYPKVGFFMSTWVMENYLAEGQPIFRRILREKHPQFLLANTPYLDFNFPRDNSFFEINYDILEEDRKVLEENFVRYWGMVWVPGKVLYANTAGEQLDFEILIPGPYVIESNGQVVLDTMSRSPGEQIMLTSGMHTAQLKRKGQKVVLRWGKINNAPHAPPPAISTFFGF